MRLLIDKKKLLFSEKGDVVTYKLLPIGRFCDRRYGWLDFSKERLEAIAKRFNDNIPAYEIFITEEHWGTDKVATIKNCYFIEEKGLYIECEIHDNETFDKFDYMSAELEPYIDKINGGTEEETLLGCALTNRPANPFVDKIKLSETEEVEIITIKKNKEKEGEELSMTDKERLEQLEKENKQLKENEIKLSEKAKKDKFEGKKAIWLSGGVAPASIEVFEKLAFGKKNEDGKILLSEGATTTEVDTIDIIDKVVNSIVKIDLSEYGTDTTGKIELGETDSLLEIAEGI